MALSRFMDQIGDWNPQLLRELRGRLTLKNLIITLCLSFGYQWLIGIGSRSSIISRPLQGTLPFILIVLGSYLLSYDLSKEYRQRTIEFIRLTPQSSQEILIGKFLGVPILVYIAILAAIPLHFSHALRGINPLLILGSYSIWMIKAWLFYSFGLLYTLTLLKQRHHNYPSATIAGSVAFLALILNQFNGRYFFLHQEKWYGLNFSQSSLLHLIWSIILLTMIGHFFWRILNRQFQNFKATLITKQQSYQMTLFINLFLLGFIVHSPHPIEFTFLWLLPALPILSLVLIPLLLPNRQYLLDWARYGHLNQHKGFWKDLIWGEKSPPIMAIFINALITSTLWISFLFINPSTLINAHYQPSILQLLLCPLLTIGIILIYGMVAQILMLNPSSRAKELTIAGMAIVVIMPPLLAITLQVPSLWLLSPLPMLGLYKGSTVAYFIGLGLQLVILGLLTAKLKQQIYLVGASESQLLLQDH